MKKDNNKVLQIVGIGILFVFAFIILVDKQNEKSLADVSMTELNYTTIEGKQIVVRDVEAIYPKYYVIYFDNSDNSYIIHSFNYYQTDSQYNLEFDRLRKSIVDYDYNNLMIRYVYDEGYGTYNDVYTSLSEVIDGNKLEVY